MFSEVTIRVSWGTLAAKRKAHVRDTHPTLICLHGWLDNANSFDPIWQFLNYPGEIIALDLPGHGLSQHRPAGTNYFFIDGVADLADVVQSIDKKPVVLLGHSMGGAIAALYAMARPETVQCLILIESLGPLASEPKEIAQSLPRFLAGRENLSQKRPPQYPSREQAITARLKVGGISQNSVETLCQRGLMESATGWQWRTDPRLTVPSPFRLTETQVQESLKSLKPPTLVIYGDGPTLVDRAALAERILCCPSLKKVELSGGHHLHMDHPQIVAPEIQAFLATQGISA